MDVRSCKLRFIRMAFRSINESKFGFCPISRKLYMWRRSGKAEILAADQ